LLQMRGTGYEAVVLHVIIETGIVQASLDG